MPKSRTFSPMVAMNSKNKRTPSKRGKSSPPLWFIPALMLVALLAVAVLNGDVSPERAKVAGELILIVFKVCVELYT
jgi:fatty acid desaturase